jgi:hypothetical protein
MLWGRAVYVLGLLHLGGFVCGKTHLRVVVILLSDELAYGDKQYSNDCFYKKILKVIGFSINTYKNADRAQIRGPDL